MPNQDQLERIKRNHRKSLAKKILFERQLFRLDDETSRLHKLSDKELEEIINA